jgi:predicted DNA-binding transcriptional regulator AlpA
MNDAPAYLSPAATARRFSMSRSHLDQLVVDGKWPKPFKLGNIVRHKVSTCDAYFEGRVDVTGSPVEQETA